LSGAATATDVLDLSSLTDFAEVMADVTQNGANTLLSSGAGRSVTLAALGRRTRR
jgi:hypothetical protein